MRSLNIARRELQLMKQIVDEFLQDYEYAQSEEDMSSSLHQEYARKISEAYWKYKDIKMRLDAFAK